MLDDKDIKKLILAQKEVFVTKEEFEDFYEENKFKLHSNEILQLNAKEVINKFYENNNFDV